MKKAFTMIEIIFVIVIIGILAVVSIHKLSATYDDAKVTISLNEIGTLINDISTYYITKKYFASKIEDMTHIKDINYSVPWNIVSQSGVLTYYTINDDSNLEPCVLFSMQNQDGNLTIENIPNPLGTICTKLQSVYSYRQLLGTKLVGGNRIKF